MSELEALRARVSELEAQLEQTRRATNQAFHTMPAPMLLHDAEGRLVDANAAAGAMLGYSREQLLTLRAEDHLDEECRDTHARFFATREPRQILVRQHRADGSPIDLQVWVAPVELDGRLHLLSIARDLCSQVGSQVATAHLEGLYETVQAGIMIQHRSGVIRYANQRARQAFGMDDVVGRDSHNPTWEMVDEQGQPVPADEHPSMITLRTGQAQREVVRGLFSSDPRRTRWLLISTAPILDATGDVEEVLITFSDITTLRRAEERQRESAALLRMAMEAAHEGLWDWNLTTGEVRWDELARRMLGYDEQSFVPHVDFCMGLVHPDDRDTIDQAIAAHQADPTQPFAVRFRMRRGDGDWNWLDSRASTLSWTADGRPERLVGVHRDIQAQVQAEADRETLDKQLQHTQKLESLGVLAGGIAHDFANILLAVLGNASLALEDLPLASPVRSNLEQIEQSARRATTLCKQMLAYSGKGHFVVRPLDLSGIVEEMGQMLQVSISKKAVLRYDLARNLPPVEGDSSQISQVVMNLITNASDAIGDRSGVISLRTGIMACDRHYLSNTWLHEGQPEGLYAYIEVSDTGEGMDAETQKRIFEPFFTTRFTGRGLGLAATLGIVRGHRGAIRVYSEPGKGTTIKVLFPITAEAQASHDLEVNNARGTHWSGSGLVLLVDDEEAVRTLARRILERVGYAVVSAENGREALRIFKARPAEFSFVLLDLTMPHMDGEQAFRALRRVRPDVPVILSSGYSPEDVTTRFLGKGLTGFIQKPYRPQELVKQLRTILDEG